MKENAMGRMTLVSRRGVVIIANVVKFMTIGVCFSLRWDLTDHTPGLQILYVFLPAFASRPSSCKREKEWKTEEQSNLIIEYFFQILCIFGGRKLKKNHICNFLLWYISICKGLHFYQNWILTLLVSSLFFFFLVSLSRKNRKNLWLLRVG